MSRLRFATWNVQEGMPEGATDPCALPSGLAALVRLVRRHAIDVLALQEVDFDESGRSAVLEALCAGTELRQIRSHVLSDSSFFPGRRAGVAVASRLPVVDATSFLTPNPGLRATMHGRQISSHDKGGVICTLGTGPGRYLKAVSLHMLPFHVFRKKPDEPEFGPVWTALAEQLHRAASSGAPGPLLVGGDFNTEQRGLADPEGRFGRVVGDRLTHHGFAADDILFSPALKLVGSEVVDSFSDHHLCLADLEAHW